MSIGSPTPVSGDHAFQRSYFRGRGRNVRIAPDLTDVGRRHLTETLALIDVRPGSRVLELGCGLGRFTGPMLELGLEVTATDISPELVRSLAERLGGRPGLTVVAAPAEELGDQVEGGFDAVVGFFFLHHLRRLEPVLGVCRRLLRPGGRLAFCEPNGLNPLYYLQVTLTPGMSWRGEPGVPKMRPRVVLPALQAAGFERTAHSSYGFLPPRLAMTRPGRRIERVLETSQALRGLRAYRVFAAGSAA